MLVGGATALFLVFIAVHVDLVDFEGRSLWAREGMNFSTMSCEHPHRCLGPLERSGFLRLCLDGGTHKVELSVSSVAMVWKERRCLWVSEGKGTTLA